MIVDKVATDTIPVWKAKIIEKENIKELLDKIRAEIEEQVVPRSVYTDKQKKQVLAIIDKYRKGSEETETWNGIHAQITAPKGTFERIWNDAERGEE